MGDKKMNATTWADDAARLGRNPHYMISQKGAKNQVHWLCTGGNAGGLTWKEKKKRTGKISRAMKRAYRKSSEKAAGKSYKSFLATVEEFYASHEAFLGIDNT